METSLEKDLKSAYRAIGKPLKNATRLLEEISDGSQAAVKAIRAFCRTCREAHRHHRAEVLSKNRQKYHAKRYYEDLRRQWKEEDRPHFSVIYNH